jgi:hypothetical protein
MSVQGRVDSPGRGSVAPGGHDASSQNPVRAIERWGPVIAFLNRSSQRTRRKDRAGQIATWLRQGTAAHLARYA